MNNIFSLPIQLFVCILLLAFSSQFVLAEEKVDENHYVLGTGDQIRIQVYDEEDMYLETRVSDRGTISYPFLGEIKVVGSTPAQLENTLLRN